MTSIAARDIFKATPIIAFIIDPRFMECKFLAPEKHIEVHGALSGLVCKEKMLLEKNKTMQPVKQVKSISL